MEKIDVKMDNVEFLRALEHLIDHQHEVRNGRFAVPASSCKRAGAMSDARRSERIGRAARFSERQLQAWVLDHREQACTQRNRRQSSRA